MIFYNNFPYNNSITGHSQTGGGGPPFGNFSHIIMVFSLRVFGSIVPLKMFEQIVNIVNIVNILDEYSKHRAILS